jgi:hypothetical protein
MSDPTLAASEATSDSKAFETLKQIAGRGGLLIVPASLRPQWEREWPVVSRSSLRIVDGNADARKLRTLMTFNDRRFRAFSVGSAFAGAVA